MRAVFLVVMLLGIFTGCATSYQPMGQTGGYQQTQLNQNTFAIQFYGNGYTSHKTVVRYARLRAAEIGKELQFKYVAFLGQEDKSSASTISMPTTTYANGYGGYTTYGGAQQIIKPATHIIAKYFEEKPEGRFLDLHNIEDLYNSLSLK